MRRAYGLLPWGLIALGVLHMAATWRFFPTLTQLELSPHLFKRMGDRGFNEVDLRRMLSAASRFRPDVVPDRWIIVTHRRKLWEVVVEPDADVQLLVVVTAYPVET